MHLCVCVCLCAAHLCLTVAATLVDKFRKFRKVQLSRAVVTAYKGFERSCRKYCDYEIDSKVLQTTSRYCKINMMPMRSTVTITKHDVSMGELTYVGPFAHWFHVHL